MVSALEEAYVTGAIATPFSLPLTTLEATRSPEKTAAPTFRLGTCTGSFTDRPGVLPAFVALVTPRPKRMVSTAT